MGLKYNIGIVFVLLFIGLATASMNETKLIVCNSINITEPNCTIWWTTLNLTELNFTNVNYTNITYTNITNINLTVVYQDYGNKTIINTNHSTIQNNSYIAYNYTGNLSDINFSYSNEQIKNFISAGEIDTKISNALGGYALKTEIESQNFTSIKELKDNLLYWKWSFVFVTIIILVAIGILFSKE